MLSSFRYAGGNAAYRRFAGLPVASARHLVHRRALALLVALALLLNFLGSGRMHAPARDRFDFSAALCLTAASAPAEGPAPAAPAERPADGAASCCALCCGGDLPLAATPFRPPGRVACPVLRRALPAGIPRRLARWLPQHPRAPPLTS